MSERKNGFYWLRIDDYDWFVGEWDADLSVWRLTGSEGTACGSDFSEIGPRIESPSERKV